MYKGLIVFICGVLFAPPVVASKFLNIEFPESVSRLSKLEISFDMTRTYDNPYNPTEVEIDAVFTLPSGESVTVPAFWFQNFNRELQSGVEQLRPSSEPDWRVRFTPEETGTYSFYLTVRDIDGENRSNTQEFSVTSAEGRGFIRVDPANPRFLSFDNGDFYFPMGQNVAWAGNRGTYDYDLWMPEMGQAQENWMRIWLTHFYKGQTLEWNENHSSGWYHGVGRYSQQGAWKLDYIVQQAEALGIYIQFVTQHHGQFSQNVNPNWEDNPYNVDNGGFLQNGAEFFTNKEAKELYKRKMRYTVARWGYSPAILAWELWNEVQYTDNYNSNYPNVADWHQEMAEYTRNIDPWNHLITTSARDEDELIWSLPELDITQIHYYGPGVAKALRQRHLHMQQYGKPNIVGEFGDNTGSGGSDPSGTVMHQGIWATSMVGGGAMPWWWDNYVHPNDLYYHWAALAEFWEGEDLRTGDLQVIEVQCEGGPTAAEGVRATPGLGWATSTQREFWVEPDGTVPGIENLSQYLHGSSKSNMGREAIFHTNFSQEITFTVRVNQMSSWQPGRLQLFLDDETEPQVDAVPDPPEKFSITVPAGEHTLRVFNSGVDWFVAEYYEFGGLNVSAASGYAFTVGDKAYAWIYDRDYENGESPHGSLSNVEAIFPDLQGEFQVQQWDTRDGGQITAATVTDKQELRVSLAEFTGDIALKLVKTGTGVGSRNTPVEKFGLLPSYPNPFNDSTTLAVHIPHRGRMSLAIFDILGRQVHSIHEGEIAAGRHTWNLNSQELASGVYVVKATHADQIRLQKISLLK
mgnify:CR=1 FL=1